MKAIIGNMIAPGLLDRYLARAGYLGQLTQERLPPDSPNNLFQPVRGAYAAHGRFDSRARSMSVEAIAGRHRMAVWAFVGLLGGAVLGRFVGRGFG